MTNEPNEPVFTYTQIEAAIHRLAAHVAEHCDSETSCTIFIAGLDILAILDGEWDEEPDIAHMEAR